MVTDRKCLMQTYSLTHLLSYPKSRDAIASKKKQVFFSNSQMIVPFVKSFKTCEEIDLYLKGDLVLL